MRSPPPEVLASWPKPNYVDPQRRGNEGVIVQAILVVLVTAIVIIRLYARIVITRAGIGLDDAMIIISWVFAMGLTASVMLAIKRYGWDIHVWDLPPKDMVTSRMISWASMVLYMTTASLAKASILVFYLRILVAKIDKIVTKITLGVVVVYYIAAFLILCLQCRPLQHYWEILIPKSAGTCIDESIHMITSAAFNILIEIVIFLIPLRSLFALRIRTTQKVHLISLFSAGLLVIAASTVRLVYVVIIMRKSYDVSWYGYVGWLWASIEVHVSIICACVPSCRAFFVAWNRSSSKGGSKTGGPSGTYPSGAGRSYNNIEDDVIGLTDRRLGTQAMVSARSRSRRSESEEDSMEGTKGVTIQMEVMQYEEEYQKEVRKSRAQNSGRYSVHDKLGYGGYSTVWLARDLQEKQWVSIKIKKAHASTDKLDDDPEIQVLRALEKYYVGGPQDRPRSFVRLLAWFHHEGPNGTHNCLVTELLGPSISGILKVNKSAGGFLAPDTILRASRQLLEGIEFAHQAGFVHGVERLGPLPPAWDTRWNEMIAGDKGLEDEKNNCDEGLLITDTFEPRRQAIIQGCEEVEMVYQRDEYTDDDYEGLKCLLRVIVSLLRYEPDERVSVQEALSYIDWVDHRVEIEEAEKDEAEKDKTEEDDAENYDEKKEELEKDKAEVDEADSLGE
ncbi:hypothetical protein V501_07999 [Pseudogymnoascus sp. VKM F-4519 (FW-2642)]|nr:hypothetical protein V501_07999 [Pseudogymnoascus sp. VKM F-4519 (FW-2642)]